MKAIAGSAERGPVISAAVVVGALALLGLTVFTASRPLEAAPVIAVLILFAVAYRTLLRWESLLGLLIIVVLFIPMRRYVLPGSLPFELEPYRLLVAFIMAGWLASLLADPRVRLRRSGFEAPLILVLAATVGSLLANGSRIAQLETDVVKNVTFLLSFVLVFYLIVSVVRKQEQLDLLLRFLVGGGAIIAVLSIIESRTQYNIFNDLYRVIPLLEPRELATAPLEGRGLRSYASAQHPIALGAALVMLIPPAVYLAKRTALRRWGLAAGLLALGALATLSRTSVVMLLVVLIVFAWLRPREMKRLWPLALPLLVAVHIALPGTLGTLKNSFFPAGGLIAEQNTNKGYRGQGRVADIGPALQEFAEKPLFGQGYGTRIVDLTRQNAQILDDQWLVTLLETGLLGVAAWLWFILRGIRRLAKASKDDASPRGWLFVALTASIIAYAVGMLTYDAFAFIQVTFLFFILLAFGCAALSMRMPRTVRGRAPLPGVTHRQVPVLDA
jgi:O-antigen ligase